MLCRCRVCLAAPLSVFLALALSLSPALSCYAYAEGSPEGQETADERPEERRAVGSGDEPREGAEEPEDDSEVGEGADKGEVTRPVLPEVPFGVGSGSGGSANSGVDGASEDAYSSGWRWAEPSVSGDVEGAYQGAYFSDLASPSQGGIMLLAGFGGSLTGGFGGAFSGGSGLGKSANTTDVVDSFTAAWGWGYNSSVAHLYANSPAGWLKSIKDNTGSIVSKLGSVSSGQDSLLSLLQKQWGYGYGGTVVIESNSPAAWLQSSMNRLATERSVAGESSGSKGAANLLGGLLDSVRKQWGYGYGGTVVIESNSPAALLQSINGNVSLSTSRLIDSNSKLTVSGLLASIKSTSELSVSRLLDPKTNKTAAMLLGTTDGNVSLIASRLIDSNSKLTVSGLLASIKSTSELSVSRLLDPNTNKTAAMLLGTTDGNVSLIASRLIDPGSNLTVAALLGDMRDYMVADSKLLSKGLSDILAKMDSINVSFDGSVSVDMSGVERRLDDIAKLLLVDAAVENAKDLVSAIVGDFDKLASPGLVGEVSSAASTAFPFCVPAVVKQMLGLLQADPLPPKFDFEIGGEVMHVDASGMQGFADMVGWACRLLLVFGLAVSSRRFIYTPGGAQA